MFFRNAVWIPFHCLDGNWIFWYIHEMQPSFQEEKRSIVYLKKNYGIGYYLVLKLNPCTHHISGVGFFLFICFSLLYVTWHCSGDMTKAKTQKQMKQSYTYLQDNIRQNLIMYQILGLLQLCVRTVYLVFTGSDRPNHYCLILYSDFN